jgi:hypothetical protein
LIEVLLSIDPLADTGGRGDAEVGGGENKDLCGRTEAEEGMEENCELASVAGDAIGEKGRLGRYEYAVDESGRFLRRSATVDKIALSKPAAWARSNRP